MTNIQSATSTPVTGTPPAVSGWTLIACGMAQSGSAPVGAVLSVKTWQGNTAEFGSAHYGLGAKYPVIIADVIGGNDGQFTVDVFDDTTYRILSLLLTSQATLWLANPFGQGWYVRAGYQGGSSASLTAPSTSPAAALTANLPEDSGASKHRTFAVVYVEQPRPTSGPA